MEYPNFEWVDWLNNRHLLESIGKLLPAEAEACRYAGLEIEAMAACIATTSLRQNRRSSDHSCDQRGQ